MARFRPDIVIDARMIDSGGIGSYLKALLPAITQSWYCVLLGDPAKLPGYRVIPYFAPIYSPQLLSFKVPPCRLFWSPHFNLPLKKISAEKIVVSIHDVYHLAFSKQIQLWKVLYAYLLLKNAFYRSDAIITGSEFSKKEMLRYLGGVANKVQVIPYSINMRNGAKKENKYGLPQQYMLFVGNVKPHKNLARLLQACDKPLVIVGRREGFLSKDRKLDELLEKDEDVRKRVFFTGYVPDEDLPAIYSQARALVFPSLYEGFGLPLLEAMVCGCPVIASQVASLPEVCGDAACYVNPYSLESMKGAIDKMWNDEDYCRQLRERGYARALKFSHEQMVQEHTQLFQSLL